MREGEQSGTIEPRIKLKRSVYNRGEEARDGKRRGEGSNKGSKQINNKLERRDVDLRLNNKGEERGESAESGDKV